MIRTILICAALVTWGGSTPALAHKPLKPQELAKLDLTKGYILVRVGITKGASPVILARINEVTGNPTEGFALSSKEYSVASTASANIISTDGKSNLYLIPAEPGLWVIAATEHTAFSMGTYGFKVDAGEIVDIGTVYTGREDGASEVPEIAAAKLSDDLVKFGTLMNIVMSDALMVVPDASTPSVPDSVKKLPLHPAALIPDVRFDNIYGLLPNRALGLPPFKVDAPAPVIPPAG